MRRFLQSRGMRKFLKDRMAVAGSAVIAVYFVIAVAVGVFGAISLRDTKIRVLPNRYPGFLEAPSIEERFAFDRWWWKAHVEPVLMRSKGFESQAELRRVASEEIDTGPRKMADLPVDQALALGKKVDGAYGVMEQALFAKEDADDEVVSYHDEIHEDEAAGKTVDAGLRDALAQAKGQASVARKQALGAMDTFESALAELVPLPTGTEGLWYHFLTFLGSDSKGASVSAQAVYSIKIAFQVGLVTSLVSVVLGSLLGAAGAFFGGWIDQLVMWLVSTLSSIPYLVLLTVIAYAFTGSDLFDNPDRPALALVPIYVAFCSVFWIGTCRVVRGEVLKIKELEYVQAATAVGFSRPYILMRHVLPNTAHLMFINFSLLFIGAIKSEVILSFLGLGVKGQSSWGIMINLGRDGVTSFQFWEVGVATVFMFVLVLAFNVVSDALQDAFDPKHVS